MSILKERNLLGKSSRCCVVVDTAVLYSRGPSWLKSRGKLFWLRLYDFPQSIQANGGVALKVGHDGFLPLSFQFVSYKSSYHLALHNLGSWKTSLNMPRLSRKYFPLFWSVWWLLFRVRSVSQCASGRRDRQWGNQGSACEPLSAVLKLV
jgi:hypothetical protein